MTEAFVKYPTGGKHIAKIENINRLTVLVKTLLSVRHRQQNIEIQTGNNNNKKKKSELNPRNASRPKLSLSHGRLLVPWQPGRRARARSRLLVPLLSHETSSLQMNGAESAHARDWVDSFRWSRAVKNKIKLKKKAETCCSRANAPRFILGC